MGKLSVRNVWFTSIAAWAGLCLGVAVKANPITAVAPLLPQPSSGNLQLDVDLSTGHLYLVGNNVDVTAYNIDSAGGKFVVGATKHPYATLKDSPNTVQAWNVLEADALHLSENITTANPQPSEHFDVSGPYDLTLPGTQLWTGTSLGDLSFDYGDGQLNHHIGAVVAVPEPAMATTLALGAAVLVLGRKRFA